MLLLSAIRLVRWYHFLDQIVQTDGHTLLAGLNGSGKSTIQDAMQLLMTGDQGMVRFNRAANDRTKRSTYGYVRHEVQLEQGNGTRLEYRRPACTGWLACQFHDPEDPKRLFTAGLVLDAAESQKSVEVGHFILPGRVVDTLPIFQSVGSEQLVRNKTEARRAIREVDRHAWQPDAQTYRRELRQRLGVRSEKFHKHLIQAAAYQPVDDLRRFVSEYLAEPRPVQTEALVENLEHLRQFAAEAQRIEGQVAALDIVCAKGDEVAEARRAEQRTLFVLRRADMHQTSEAVTDLETREAEQEILKAEAEGALARATQSYNDRDRQLQELVELLGSDPDAQRLSELERRKSEALDSLELARQAEDDAAGIVASHRRALDALLAPDLEVIRTRFGRKSAEAPFFMAGGDDTLRRLSMRFGQGLASDRIAIALADQALHSVRSDLQVATTRLRDQAEKLRKEGESLHHEEQELQRGRQSYSAEVEGLLLILDRDLRGRRPARPLCELIEVPDERWRGAAEAVLGRSRTSIIIDPADFDRALDIYREHRSGVRLPDGRMASLFGVGLVNLAGVQRDLERRVLHARSLAHEITTDDPLARSYVDYLLGDMVCCDHPRELKQHRRAVEPDGMRYQSHEATQLRIDGRHLIGYGARKRRLAEIGERLAQINPELARLNRDFQTVGGLTRGLDEALRAGPKFEQVANTAERRPQIETDIASIERQLDTIDRGKLDELLAEKQARERERGEAHNAMIDTNARVKVAEAAILTIQEELPRALQAQERASTTFEKAFGLGDPGVTHAEFEEWYIDARSRVAGPADVYENYTRQFATAGGRLSNLRGDLIKLRSDFNGKYGLDLPSASADDFESFYEYRRMLRDTRMRDYQERIDRERDRALEHLANDIVQQLSMNFRHLQSEFDLLNRALAKRPFNGDRYEFTKIVQPEMAYFFETVEEAQRIDTRYGSLWEAAQHEELSGLRERLEDMLRRLTDAQGKQAKDELERFIDYRAYFNYDIRIHKESGGWQSYNMVFGTGSGGQTQTPYYVAIFSAMRALYTAGGRQDSPEFGLVMLDEAFKALDGPRIEAVVRFAGSLGLQLLLATPLEKVQLISAHVNRTQVVIWDEGATAPVVLDYTKSLQELAHSDQTRPGMDSDEPDQTQRMDAAAVIAPDEPLSPQRGALLPAAD